MTPVAHQFRRLYAEFWPKIEPLLSSRPELSPPLLLNPPDQYEQQRTRLFVIGQETHTWYNDRLRGKKGEDAIDTLMTIYKDEFHLGTEHRTVFWQAVRDLERQLGIDIGAILWSNLNKADESARRPSPEMEAKLLRCFPVLERELILGKPDVVIFFTGPRYDRLIEANLRGARLTTVGFPEHVLARVVHKLLPPKAFRTYHPIYLRRQKLTSTVLSRLGDLCGAI